MGTATLTAPEQVTDTFPINGTDFIEFYVGNAKQAAHFYRNVFGYKILAYRGPETGTRDRASYILEQGKVRLVGVSNFDVPLLERCEASRQVDSLQPPFSLIRRDAAARLIPWCADHGTGVICYSPMQSGLLTDNFSRERVARFAADDWRRRSPEFQEPNLSRNLALRDALRPIAQRHGTTVSAVAIAWTNAWPGVTGAIVGARSPEQVDGWIGAAYLELTSADLEEIAAAIERTGAGTGPTLPQPQHVRPAG